jgi:hypothetical protein
MENFEYERKITVGMVPYIWIGAAFWPFILLVGVTEFSSYGYNIPLAMFFIFLKIFSIFQGLKAFKHGIYSDFIMLAVIPFMLPILLGTYYCLNVICIVCLYFK